MLRRTPCLPEFSRLRWLSAKDGRVLDEQSLDNPARACLLGADASTLVASGNIIIQTAPGTMPKKKAGLNGQIVAMDYVPTRKELWVVLNRYQIVRLDQQFKAVQTYGKAPRPDGTFRPEEFNGLHDIAADLKGGCYAAEPTHAPLRPVHLGRNGSIKGQWFGGMSFYVHGCFDPEDPSLLYGIAPEGSVNVYRIDYQNQSWEIVETYRTGRLGDGLFPFTGSFRVVRKAGKTFLYSRVIPSVIQLDPEKGALPVAIAGTVRNRGRSLGQFAGTGRDGYPKPWVTAAEHHGFKDLKKAPKLFPGPIPMATLNSTPKNFDFIPTSIPSSPRKVSVTSLHVPTSSRAVKAPRPFAICRSATGKALPKPPHGGIGTRPASSEKSKQTPTGSAHREASVWELTTRSASPIRPAS
ncbi:MAG: hypothetical protein ACON5N_17865 [Akkermansiaceae bacterium]